MSSVMLEGKVAIVTGGGRGIGRGEALMLAQYGARVVVNDLGAGVDGSGDDESPADEVVALIKERGGDAIASYDDISDFQGAGRCIATALDVFGGLDVLVNNAGITRDRMIFNMAEEDFDAVIKVHLKGTWNTMHHASRYWRARSKGGEVVRASVVNTVSSVGLLGQASQSNYGAAKAGVAALTLIASLELDRYGVRVNAFSPTGLTRMQVAARGGGEVRNPEEYTSFDPWNPGNSAPVVVWLASDESIPVTGQVLRVFGDSLAVYRPWQLGEQFLARGASGEAAQWDPADIGPTLFKYHWRTTAPGIDQLLR